MSVIKKIFLSLILVSAILFIVEIDKIYAADTPDSVMAGADSFITDGEKNVSYNKDELHNTSNFLYNLLLGLGIIVAVIVGIIIGIKYMIGSIDEKAECKQLLLPYFVSCFVVFGAFGIWKLAVNIFSKI